MKKLTTPILLAVAAVLGCIGTSAYAVAVDSISLTVFNSSNVSQFNETVQDNGTGDVNNVSGAITVLNFAEDGYNFTVTSAITYNTLGTATFPVMDLGISGAVSGLVAGDYVVIDFQGVGYQPSSPPVKIGTELSAGQSQFPFGSIGYTTVYNEATTDTTLTSTSLTGGGVIKGSSSTLLTSSPYTLDQILTLKASGNGTISIDATLNPVPDGGETIALLGLAIAGLGAIRFAGRKFLAA
jgi:hypothetical protein